jgi:adenylate cyclase class 2
MIRRARSLGELGYTDGGMGSRTSKLETEIKLPLASAAAGRKMLRRLGFRIAQRRVFESNTMFDTPATTLQRGGTALRVRMAGRRHTITFKGAPRAGPHKSREEIETAIADAGAARDILARLGYRPVFRYEKYRTEYRKPGQTGVVTLDETPLGAFLELEGAPRWIDRTARELGFSPSDYVTASYGRLWLDRAKKGAAPADMVFSAGT